MASLVCGLSPDSIDHQRELIMEKVGVRLNPFKNICEFYFKTKRNDAVEYEHSKDNYFTPVNIALAVISLVLVVAVIVIVYMYVRCKRRDDDVTRRITSLNNTNLHLEGVSRVSYKPQVVESEQYLMIES